MDRTGSELPQFPDTSSGFLQTVDLYAFIADRKGIFAIEESIVRIR